MPLNNSYVPSDVSEELMSLFQRFVLLMYDRISNIMEVNDARMKLFAEKSRTRSNIPPNACGSPEAHHTCLSAFHLLE